MKNKKLFLASLTALVAIPSAVYIVPANDHVEAAKVDKSTSHEGIFKDVSSESPYFEIINEMHNLGYISGYPDGTFKPEENISRKHVAALLSRVLPLEPVRQSKEFKDVQKTHLHYDIIQRVQRAGIMDGDQNGNFNPEAFLTRVQMAKIIDLAFDLSIKSEIDFKDVPPAHWGNRHVRALYSNGITTGYQGEFKPTEKVTRAHYAVFLHRALNLGNEDQLAQKLQGQFSDISDKTLETSFDEGVNMMLSMIGQKITYGEPGHLITDGEVYAATMQGTQRQAQMARENILYLKRFVKKDSEFEKILDRWFEGDFSEVKNDIFTLLAQDADNMAGDNWNDPSRISIVTKEAEEHYVLKIHGDEALKRHKEQYK
ncbi:S-layer homology domain-containing protein [Sporosarcina limicola]|uniref:SLH domain-containing protein n=1 Tax=Sporosarcina limicola TaxID=34101 RepID=A0A927R747_9BACL|nr:S-layer homology domain-containing protein [Sporosarcina limicola]MBE1555599.1 hypothetical protein [Sporosarcina limicola]